MGERCRLLHVFFDTDMRCRHDGLWERAKKDKVKRANLKPGDLLAFINSAKDRVMALAVIDETDSYGVLGYYRSPHGRVDPLAIQYIADAFSGGQINFNKATEQALRERLEKKTAAPT